MRFAIWYAATMLYFALSGDQPTDCSELMRGSLVVAVLCLLSDVIYMFKSWTQTNSTDSS